jgi:hypothetical protein
VKNLATHFSLTHSVPLLFQTLANPSPMLDARDANGITSRPIARKCQFEVSGAIAASARIMLILLA